MTDIVARMKALPDLTNEKAWEVVYEGAKEIERLRTLVDPARKYKDSREACPIGDWQDRIEKAGWELAQAVRAYDKASVPTP